MSTFARLACVVLFGLPFFGVLTGRVIIETIFNRDCSGYLKRAADANTVELAQQELKKVVTYLQNTKKVSGYTSIFYNTPDEDVGFWYQNLAASLRELEKINESTTQLERSNVLIKLRETLLDNGEQGSSVTLPKGIAVFPSNVFWFFLFWLSFGFALISAYHFYCFLEK